MTYCMTEIKYFSKTGFFFILLYDIFLYGNAFDNDIVKYIKDNNVKNILEVGAAIGYSSIMMCGVDEDITDIALKYGMSVNELLKFGIDPMTEICSVLVYELYEAFYEICRNMQFHRSKEQSKDNRATQIAQQHIQQIGKTYQIIFSWHL